MKLALNQLIASLTVGFSTSLALLQRNNVDIDKFMDILRPSALYAPTFDKKLQRMLDREYSNPNFPTKVRSHCKPVPLVKAAGPTRCGQHS